MKKNTAVVIIGGGLSGLTAASYLADIGTDVTILEQGHDYIDRCPNNSEDVLIGLGGAGTLSGGKLCFPPASSGIWKKTRDYMNEFDVFYKNRFSKLNTVLAIPTLNNGHHSTGIFHKPYRTEVAFKTTMYEFIMSILRDIKQKGVNVRCNCRADSLYRITDGYAISICNETNEYELLHSNYVLIATGRTSTPFLQKLFGTDYSHQPDLGIRLSFDAKQSSFSTIGEDVKLKLKLKDYLIRTFCVCCGGDAIKTSTRGYTHYDGHFEAQPTSLTNLGILARSANYAGPMVAEHYLQTMQKNVNKEISLKDFTKYYSLLTRNTIYEPLFEAISSFVSEIYKIGYIVQNPDEIPVMLPAVDNFNAPISTNSGFESRFRRIYVIGDAAGVSRGFVQAMWAGHCAAERISNQILCTKENVI